MAKFRPSFKDYSSSSCVFSFLRNYDMIRLTLNIRATLISLIREEEELYNITRYTAGLRIIRETFEDI